MEQMELTCWLNRPYWKAKEGRGCSEGQQGSAPTNAEAKRVKPIANGAILPWPGLVTAVAYTTCKFPHHLD